MAKDKRGRGLPKGIRQRGDSFEGRFMINGESYSVNGKTVTETKKRMNDLRFQVEHGQFVSAKKITLDDWFVQWMETYKKNSLKVNTYQKYFEYYRFAIKDTLGSKQLQNIRGEHIQSLYNRMVEEGYCKSTIKVVGSVLHGCFKQALKNGLVLNNPTSATTLPKQESNRHREALTRTQQTIFMEYAKDSYLYNFFAVMLSLGLRNGECRGLKITDIDRKNKTLHVQRTLICISGMGYIEDTPKTKTSDRIIPLTEATLKLLDNQKNYWGFKIERMDRYLFCNEKGEALSRERVQFEINRIVKRINANGYEFPRITTHVFRHTFATRAIENGMSPQVLKTILGHSSISMTMDLYSHVLPDTKASEMEKIACAFNY